MKNEESVHHEKAGTPSGAAVQSRRAVEERGELLRSPRPSTAREKHALRSGCFRDLLRIKNEE